jgi:hypothetical protein
MLSGGRHDKVILPFPISNLCQFEKIGSGKEGH